MNRESFVVKREARWQELDRLLRRGRAGRYRGLNGAELMRLGELYRLVTSDLAVARRDFPRDSVTIYLNGLAGRAHPLVYQEKGTSLRHVGRFVRFGFPQAWRETSRYIVVAFSIFVLAAVVAAVLVTWRLSLADILMPGDAKRLRGYMEQHQLWVQSATSNHPWAANFIMLNNIQVAFIAFAGGLVFGLGTIYEMVQNGIMFGVVSAMIRKYGLDLPFWSFVVAHGVIELSVVFMAGGAGLMIGDALLRPGLRRRGDALPEAARRGAKLLCGSVFLLVLAGTIESYLSPSTAPVGLKFAVGIASGVVLYGYLVFSRPDRPADAYSLVPANFDELRSTAPTSPHANPTAPITPSGP